MSTTVYDITAALGRPYYDDEYGHIVYHADCWDMLPAISHVDVVLTDPPYGINWDTKYSRFSDRRRPSDHARRGIADKRLIRQDDRPFDPEPLLRFPTVVLWGANHYARVLPTGSWLIWDKRGDDGTAFLSEGEIGWMNSGYGVYFYSYNAQRHRRTSEGLHPTQKPVGLMSWCLDRCGYDVGVVLDPFAGSGTTLVAAKLTGRSAIGIEIEGRYCEIAANRLRQEVFEWPEVRE